MKFHILIICLQSIFSVVTELFVVCQKLNNFLFVVFLSLTFCMYLCQLVVASSHRFDLHDCPTQEQMSGVQIEITNVH